MNETHQYTRTISSSDHTALLGWGFAAFKWLLESKGRVLGASCIVLTLLLIFKGLYNRYLHPLNIFPGPFWASVTDLYKLYLLSSSDLTSLSLVQHKKYGNNLLSSFGPEVIAIVMLIAPSRVYRAYLSGYALVQ